MAFDAFLKITTPDVAGESSDSKHPGEIELYSFSLGAHNTTTIGSATGGAGAGKVSFSSFSIMKKTDKTSPILSGQRGWDPLREICGDPAEGRRHQSGGVLEVHLRYGVRGVHPVERFHGRRRYAVGIRLVCLRGPANRLPAAGFGWQGARRRDPWRLECHQKHKDVGGCYRPVDAVSGVHRHSNFGVPS